MKHRDVIARDHHSVRPLEIAGALSRLPELVEKVAAAVEHPHLGVARLEHEEATLVVDRDVTQHRPAAIEANEQILGAGAPLSQHQVIDQVDLEVFVEGQVFGEVGLVFNGHRIGKR